MAEVVVTDKSLQTTTQGIQLPKCFKCSRSSYHHYLHRRLHLRTLFSPSNKHDEIPLLDPRFQIPIPIDSMLSHNIGALQLPKITILGGSLF